MVNTKIPGGEALGECITWLKNNQAKEKAIKRLNFKSDKGILYMDITDGFC